MKRLIRYFLLAAFYTATIAHAEYGCGQPYCYSCNESVEGTCHLFYGAEGLYWTTSHANLDFAVDLDTEDADKILGTGNIHFLDYDWKYGVRGWMGWNWGHGWDMKWVYTWYKNENKKTIDTTGSTIDLLASLLHPTFPENTAETAEGRNKVEYQTADCLLGKVVSLCGHTVILHPYIGTRAMRLHQDLKVTYDGEDFDDPERVKWISDLKGIGLNSGLDIHLRWKYNLGIYGNFGGSILASRSKAHHLQETLDDDDDVQTTSIELRERENVMIPGYHLSAGVSWEWCPGECFFFLVKAGYEFNRWFHTPQLRRYQTGNEGVSCSNSGNIGIHGATFSAQLHF